MHAVMRQVLNTKVCTYHHIIHVCITSLVPRPPCLAFVACSTKSGGEGLEDLVTWETTDKSPGAVLVEAHPSPRSEKP